VVLAAALENGFSPNDTIDGTSPCTISLPGSGSYVANNAEAGAGVMSLLDATANSVNCAYIRLGVDVGLPKVVDMAHRLGIPAGVKLGSTPSVSLGTYEVTPLEMASVYATLAADGVHRTPSLVQRINDPSGRALYQANPISTQAVSPQIARTTTQALQGVVQRGTGTAAQLSGRPVAGKTGTTDNLANAWFVGYTPHLAAAVWMGSPTGQVPDAWRRGSGRVRRDVPSPCLPRLHERRARRSARGRLHRSRPEPDRAGALPDRAELARRAHQPAPAASAAARTSGACSGPGTRAGFSACSGTSAGPAGARTRRPPPRAWGLSQPPGGGAGTRLYKCSMSGPGRPPCRRSPCSRWQTGAGTDWSQPQWRGG